MSITSILEQHFDAFVSNPVPAFKKSYQRAFQFAGLMSTRPGWQI